MKSALSKITLTLGVLAFCFCLVMAFKTEDVMLSKLFSALTLVTVLYLSANFSKKNKDNASDGSEYQL
jgi:hypothetical protein